MKAYTLAAILFRVGGITLLLHSAYYFFGYLNTHIAVPIHHAPLDPGYLSMFIRTFVPAIAIYFAAPLLAKIAVWKIRE